MRTHPRTHGQPEVDHHGARPPRLPGLCSTFSAGHQDQDLFLPELHDYKLRYYTLHLVAVTVIHIMLHRENFTYQDSPTSTWPRPWSPSLQASAETLAYSPIPRRYPLSMHSNEHTSMDPYGTEANFSQPQPPSTRSTINWKFNWETTKFSVTP